MADRSLSAFFYGTDADPHFKADINKGIEVSNTERLGKINQTGSTNFWISLFADPDFSTSHSDFKALTFRTKFVAKLYFILFIKLFVGMIILLNFVMREDVKWYVRGNPHFINYFFLISLAIFITICLTGTIRRFFPLNFLACLLLIITSSLFFGWLSVLNRSDTWPYAWSFTTVVCLSIAIASLSLKLEITNIGKHLLLLLGAHFFQASAINLYTAFRNYVKIGQTYKAIALSTMFTLYLTWETREILTGQRPFIGSRDIFMAAAHHFIDLLLLFTKVAQGLGLNV